MADWITAADLDKPKGGGWLTAADVQKSDIGPTSWREALMPSLASVGQFAKGAAVDTATGLYNLATTNPVDTITNLIKAQIAEPGKARDAYRDGRYSEAAGHALAALVPVLGPQAASIGEEIGNTGNIARGLGQAAALIAPITGEGRAAASRVGNAVGDVAGKAVEAAKVPGTGKVLAGGALAAGGTAMAAAGHPLAGIETAGIGAKLAKSGYDARKAAVAARDAGPPVAARSAPTTMTAAKPAPVAPPSIPAPMRFGERIPSMPVGEESLPSAVAAQAEDFVPKPPDRFKDSPEFERGLEAMKARRRKPDSPAPEASEPYRPDKPGADEAARAFKEAMEASDDDAQAEAIRRMAQPREISDVMRDLSPQMRTEAAKANYRAVKDGNAAPESAAEVYQAAHRATRHEKMADHMIEAGFDPIKAMKLPISKWHEEAIKAGVKNLKGQDIEEVIFRMRKTKK